MKCIHAAIYNWAPCHLWMLFKYNCITFHISFSSFGDSLWVDFAFWLCQLFYNKYFPIHYLWTVYIKRYVRNTLNMSVACLFYFFEFLFIMSTSVLVKTLTCNIFFLKHICEVQVPGASNDSKRSWKRVLNFWKL